MLNFAKKYAFLAVLVLILSLFIVDFLFVQNEKPYLEGSIGKLSIQEQNEDAPKLSEIEGSMIDESAVFVSVEKTKQSAAIASELPVSIWVSLIFAYAALLIFNLSYGFSKTNSPRWFWESLFTLIFLLGWIYLDPFAKNIWFPLYVFKAGLIIYFIYLYFLEKKLSRPSGL